MCENEQVVAAEMQYQMASQARSEIRTCGGGYVAFLSVPGAGGGVCERGCLYRLSYGGWIYSEDKM